MSAHMRRKYVAAYRQRQRMAREQTMKEAGVLPRSAMTNAERVKRYRQRKKLAREAASVCNEPYVSDDDAAGGYSEPAFPEPIPGTSTDPVMFASVSTEGIPQDVSLLWYHEVAPPFTGNEENHRDEQFQEPVATTNQLLLQLDKKVSDIFSLLTTINEKIDVQGRRISTMESEIDTLKEGGSIVSTPQKPVPHQEEVKKTFNPYLRWPIPNREVFEIMEAGLQLNDDEYESYLREKLRYSNKATYQGFVSTNMKHLFKHVGRFTWTGRPSNRLAGRGSFSEPAQSLEIIRVLIDTTREIFPDAASTQIITEIKKSFTYINDVRASHRSQQNQVEEIIVGDDYLPIKKEDEINLGHNFVPIKKEELIIQDCID